MTSVQTPTFLLEDRHGKLHEIDGNARVLVLARDQRAAHRWIVDQGEHPYGRRYVVSPTPRRLEGLRFDVLVVLENFDFNPWREKIWDTADRSARKMPKMIRIDG